MLLIPDIHINTQYRDQIISKLSDIVTSHPDEKHIVLLGDYVYMFSYDRDALLALYKLLIWRYHEGKTIYVLAWNHDWHGQHFVYEEARQARDIISWVATTPLVKGGIEGGFWAEQKWAIHFITTPQVYQIDWESILMMPYMIDWSSQSALFSKEGGEWNETGDLKLDSNNIPPETIGNPLEGKEGGTSATSDGRFVPHHSLYTALTQSTNKYEQASGWLNLILEHYTQNHKIDTIIHHYYTADTQFPGLRTQFSYRDVALDPYWMTAGYDVISWHIHHPFVYGSYLCCGSLWNTAANETNQFKYYWIKHSKIIQWYQTQINPHLTLPYNGSPISESDISSHRDTITGQQSDQLQSTHFDVALHHNSPISKLINLVVTTTDHHEVTDLIDQHCSSQIHSIKPKYNIIISNNQDSLMIDTEKLQTSVVNRQETLTHYITNKYPDQHQSYLDLLDELQVITKK
jgi:hypothetical protein